MKHSALLFSFTTALAAPALAANVTIIQQVGPGSIQVKQNGENNSVEIKQSIEKKGSADKPEKKKAAPPVDCNLKKLPETSQRVRAQAVIQQSGDHNVAYTSQDADETEVLLKQEGAHNSYKRGDTGKTHKSKVVQNGVAHEECETK